MAARLHEMAWVVSLLDYCPDVDVLGLHVRAGDIEAGQCLLVDMVELDVHVRDWAQAEAVARALRLSEGAGKATESGYGRLEWRVWSGWVPDGSKQLPVWVRVEAAEPVPASTGLEPKVGLGSVVA